MQETFDRRWSQRGGAARAPIMNAAYIAAYMLDPMFADVGEDGHFALPSVTLEHQIEASELVLRVGGRDAESSFELLVLSGWPDALKGPIRALVNGYAGCKRVDADAPRPKMPQMRARLGLWEKYATQIDDLKPLLNVAQRLLSAHVTSASTERNWSLWGRVYNASRNALGQERAKKMIAICNEAKGADITPDREFAVTLGIIEGDADVE
jgi:hypothetical protein